jgi:uncharacterized protein
VTVRAFYPYLRPISTPCGPTALNNALYCPISNAIYYDDTWLRRIYSLGGDAAAAVIIAHGWGHPVQAQLGLFDNRFPVLTELQADCFAGAFFQFARQAGVTEPGDVEEAAQVTFFFSEGNILWVDPRSHGTPTQRITSFVGGARFGEGYCLY